MWELFQKINESSRNLGLYWNTNMKIGDGLEILIIAFLLYYILAWMKNTRAWALLKGIIVIFLLLLLAYLFKMTTILWIAKNVLSFAVIALIVVMQPELRRALEELGQKNILGSIVIFESSKKEEETFSQRTINEIVKACTEMGKVRTGALIVIEQNESLKEFERTGIDVDAIVTSQLLINIFEKNTPLHDGAVIIRGNRVASATCYLPLSDNLTLSKELGTRHRAAVGISEASDSLTVIVSEETGRISIALDGQLERNLDGERLRERLHSVLNKSADEESKSKKRKRRQKKA